LNNQHAGMNFAVVKGGRWCHSPIFSWSPTSGIEWRSFLSV